MKCKLCETVYEEGMTCPYCGMPAIAELDGSNAASGLCAEHRSRIISRLNALSVVAYRYAKDGEEVRETQETQFLLNLREADGRTVWSEAEFLRLEPEDLAEGDGLRLALRAEGSGFSRDFTAELPLPQAEGLWRVGAQIAPNLTLTVYVGSPEKYSEISGIRFLA